MESLTWHKVDGTTFYAREGELHGQCIEYAPGLWVGEAWEAENAWAPSVWLESKLGFASLTAAQTWVKDTLDAACELVVVLE